MSNSVIIDNSVGGGGGTNNSIISSSNNINRLELPLATNLSPNMLPIPNSSTSSSSVIRPAGVVGSNNIGIVLGSNSSVFTASSPPLLSPSTPTYPTPTPTFYSDDDDNEEDTSKIIEDSPNGRWSKLKFEISSQKLLDFDSANLAIDSVC